jgi:hypothetical protein
VKLSLEQRTMLSLLGIRASNLLIEIIDEPIPSEQKPTERDLQFKEILKQIYGVCPLLSDSYMLMYNHIQKDKSEKEKLSYLKELKKDDELH